MTAYERLNEILKTIPGEFQLDEDGECQIETDAGEECLISVIEQTDQIALSIPVIIVSEANQFELFREALIINDDLTLTGSSRICFSPDEAALLLRYAAPIDNLDGEGLQSLLDATLLLADEIHEHLLSGDALPASENDKVPTMIDSGYGQGIIVG